MATAQQGPSPEMLQSVSNKLNEFIQGLPEEERALISYALKTRESDAQVEPYWQVATQASTFFDPMWLCRMMCHTEDLTILQNCMNGQGCV
jgi:hypothetical protein